MANYLVPADQAHLVKTLQTSTGNSYSYLSIPASSPSKPTLLLLHGFPNSSYYWRHQVDYFSSASQGFGLIVPDLLGYGRTSRPSDPAAYTGKKMALEMSEILDQEGYGKGGRKVHAIAHDWGCFLLGRLANWFPERLLSAAFLSVPYTPPGNTNLSWLDELNAMTKKMIGREALGYWKFFEREDAGAIVEKHFDTFFNLVFPADPHVWATSLAPVGAMEAALKSDETFKRGEYVSDEYKATYIEIMGRDLSPAMNWYRRAIACLDIPDETSAVSGSSERKLILDPKLHMPVLYLDSTNDVLSQGDRAVQQMKPLIENLTVQKIDAGHWLQLEKPQEVNKVLKDWIVGLEG